jgi:hypothetical protein
MSKRGNVHTVPNPGGNGWVNKVDGQAVSHHHRKDTASEAGRSITRQNRAEHTIHNRDGRIGEKNSYGNDPMPPRDKNR